MSTNRGSGFRTFVNTFTSVSLSESIKDVCESGGGFARCLCLATDQFPLDKKSQVSWLRRRMGCFASRSTKRCRSNRRFSTNSEEKRSPLMYSVTVSAPPSSCKRT